MLYFLLSGCVLQEEFDETKAVQDAEDYTGINNLTVAFYSGSTEVAKVTQTREDATSYETFASTQAVNIENTSAVDKEVLLRTSPM